MWQDEVFKDLKSRLTERVGVEEVIPLGSLAEGDVDKWSDLDVGLVVSLDEHTRYFPTLAWLEELGEIYAYNQSQSPEKSTTRVIFANGRRVDFTIASSQNVFAYPADPPEELRLREDLGRLTNDFRFEACLAISKFARNDRLIALHLALGLEQKCLVLAMMLRDRAAGTTHHRFGGPLNDLVSRLGITDVGILGRIEKAVAVFGDFAGQLDVDWIGDWGPIEDLLAQVKAK